MPLTNLSCEELLRYAYIEAKTPLEIALREHLEKIIDSKPLTVADGVARQMAIHA